MTAHIEAVSVPVLGGRRPRTADHVMAMLRWVCVGCREASQEEDASSRGGGGGRGRGLGEGGGPQGGGRGGRGARASRDAMGMGGGATGGAREVECDRCGSKTHANELPGWEGWEFGPFAIELCPCLGAFNGASTGGGRAGGAGGAGGAGDGGRGARKPCPGTCCGGQQCGGAAGAVRASVVDAQVAASLFLGASPGELAQALLGDETEGTEGARETEAETASHKEQGRTSSPAAPNRSSARSGDRHDGDADHTHSHRNHTSAPGALAWGGPVGDFLGTVDVLCDAANDPFRVSVMTVEAATAESMGAITTTHIGRGGRGGGGGAGGGNPLELSQIATELSQRNAGLASGIALGVVPTHTVVVGFAF
jgi:hypothetical protein